MVLETLEKTNAEVDVVVGVAARGIPLASMMANELGADFALYRITSYNVCYTKLLRILSAIAW